MPRNFGRPLVDAAKRERRRIINPEVPPDRRLGDIGFCLPELDELEREQTSWRRATAEILAFFAAAITAIVLLAWRFDLW